MSDDNFISHLVLEVTLNGHRYFVEQASDGWVYLTRCMEKCGGCPHYEAEDCNEFSSDYIFKCDREDPDVPDCYDFCEYIRPEDYPEFTEDEVNMINRLIAENDPEYQDLIGR